MRFGSVSVVVGRGMAVSAVAGNRSAAAWIISPLSFEIIKQFKSNPPSLIPSAGADRPTVEASARDLAATGPQRPPDAAIAAIRVPRGVWSSLTRTDRSAVSPARAAAGFKRMRQAYSALPVPNQPAGRTITARRTAAVPVSSTR
jgi:hypothetical protein